MDNNNISELFDYQPEERQKLQRDLRDAIEDYDIEALDKLIEDGADIKELEKESSTLSLAINSYISNIGSLLYKNSECSPNPETYFDSYVKLSSDELPFELQVQIKEQTNQLINTLDYLYEYGADINNNNGLLENVEKQLNVFAYMFYSFIFSKQLAPIEWIVKKKDFDIKKPENAKVMQLFIKSKNPDSIKGLQLMLEAGAPFYENKEYNDLVTVAPLVDCLDIQVKDKYYQDKFNLLWKYASDSQKKYLIENYNLNNSLLDLKLVEQKIIEGDLSSPLINELDFDGIDISGIKFEKPHK